MVKVPEAASERHPLTPAGDLTRTVHGEDCESCSTLGGRSTDRRGRSRSAGVVDERQFDRPVRARSDARANLRATSTRCRCGRAAAQPAPAGEPHPRTFAAGPDVGGPRDRPAAGGRRRARSARSSAKCGVRACRSRSAKAAGRRGGGPPQRPATGRTRTVPCWVIEYRGDELAARTWVACRDGKVLRQEAFEKGETARHSSRRVTGGRP